MPHVWQCQKQHRMPVTYNFFLFFSLQRERKRALLLTNKSCEFITINLTITKKLLFINVTFPVDSWSSVVLHFYLLNKKNFFFFFGHVMLKLNRQLFFPLSFSLYKCVEPQHKNCLFGYTIHLHV